MPSLSITTRKTTTGPRYVVRYRLGGRAYPVVAAGSFKTLKEAKARRDFVGGLIATGQNPADVLRAMVDPPKRRTFREWAEAFKSSRVDWAEKTHKTFDSALKTMEAFADRDPAGITREDIQEWVSELGLKPGTVRHYLSKLRAVFDYAGREQDNPARKVRLPRMEYEVVEPPTAADVDAIIANVPKRWQLPIRTLEQTGMRVGELHDLAWGDVDEAGSRFRIRAGKTAASRRWVAVPRWLMVEIAATCPWDDRTPERIVFPGFTPNAAKNAMGRACKTAGIAHYHPHDLRHRYASVKIGEGVPVTAVAAQLGHAKKSLTLDTYSHVLLEEGALT